jgi:hypothetical protein
MMILSRFGQMTMRILMDTMGAQIVKCRETE